MPHPYFVGHSPHWSHFNEGGDTNNKSEEKEEPPKFVRKWFALTDPQRHDLRMRKRDFLAKKQDGGETTEAEKTLTEEDFDELVKIVPKFAAKWFLLPQEKKKEYRRAAHRGCFTHAHSRRMMQMPPCSGRHAMPPFTGRWWPMPEQRQRWMNQMRDDVTTDQTAPGASGQNMHGRFASKWRTMSEEDRTKLREKMRQFHQERVSRARSCDVTALRNSMEDMSMTSRGRWAPARIEGAHNATHRWRPTFSLADVETAFNTIFVFIGAELHSCRG